jgi:hypothetical protein
MARWSTKTRSNIAQARLFKHHAPASPRATSGVRVYPLSLYPGHRPNQAAAVPLSSPFIRPAIFLTPDPAPAAHKLSCPSHPAPTPSGMHHTGQHSPSDTTAISASSAHLGSVSVYPTPTSSIPAPLTTSIPAHREVHGSAYSRGGDEGTRSAEAIRISYTVVLQDPRRDGAFHANPKT